MLPSFAQSFPPESSSLAGSNDVHHHHHLRLPPIEPRSHQHQQQQQAQQQQQQQQHQAQHPQQLQATTSATTAHRTVLRSASEQQLPSTSSTSAFAQGRKRSHQVAAGHPDSSDEDDVDHHSHGLLVLGPRSATNKSAGITRAHSSGNQGIGRDSNGFGGDPTATSTTTITTNANANAAVAAAARAKVLAGANAANPGSGPLSRLADVDERDMADAEDENGDDDEDHRQPR